MDQDLVWFDKKQGKETEVLMSLENRLVVFFPVTDTRVHVHAGTSGP